MDFFEGKANRRIMTGNLPSEKIIPVSILETPISDIDLLEKAKRELELFRSDPGLMYTFFMVNYSNLQEIDLIDSPYGMSCPEINIMVNALSCIDFLLPTGEVFSLSKDLKPYVTEIDRILVHSIHSAFTKMTFSKSTNREQAEEIMYAWIYLLLLVQEKENNLGLTINIDSISSSISLMEIIENDWSQQSSYYSILSVAEKDALRTLFEQRNKIAELKREERTRALIIAERSQKDWELFIEIANDLSARENAVINQILTAKSPKEKLRVINDYEYILLGLDKFRYELNGKEINMVPLLDSIIDRSTKATYYCAVRTNEEKPLILNPAFYSMVFEPHTYNYVYISFHHFRLSPRKETAYKFLRLALKCIKKNFGISDDGISDMSIAEIISDFHDTVLSFYEENSEAINRLSFKQLQENAVAEIFNSPYEYEQSMEDLAELIDSSEQQELIAKKVEMLWTGGPMLQSMEELTSQIDHLNHQSDQREEESIARQLIVSLNIIYMFCDAIRIILTNSHANIKIPNPESISAFRRKLLHLDEDIIHQVYSCLGDHEISMLDYREQSGINPNFLSAQENDEDQYRRTIFAEIFKETIETLLSQVDEQDTTNILNTKLQIRKAILRFPYCDESEQYATWLDSISSQFCDKLINNCKKESDKYTRHKNNILSKLGTKANHLPISTIDSLTTAEMLYEEYASQEYADKGFDFSCISALYYQAFENAYNYLLWNGYANKLNNLIVHGMAYTSILESRQNYDGMGSAYIDAEGYLPSSKKSRRKYVFYGTPPSTQTSVNEHCMYKSFGIIMKQIKPRSDTPKFCEYFSQLASFSDVNTMLSNSAFMQMCSDFANAVCLSADNRNNASHGGTLIDIIQCSEDKKIVLNNLEEVRNTSIGLIQQLLYLLFSHEA